MSVIMEDEIPRRDFLRRRVKKLGATAVFGQVLFMTLVVPVLRRTAAKRLRTLKDEMAATAEIENVTRIDSVNSDAGREVLRAAAPAVVVVNGTRIIGKKTLECVNAQFINMHAGITPLYRGVHGGYWALAENKSELAGTTVHLVDTGIDTGDIIEQAFFQVSPADNFVTYPHLHTRAGIEVLIKSVGRALNGELKTKKPIADLPSKLRYHPTLWEYIYYRLRHGVK